MILDSNLLQYAKTRSEFFACMNSIRTLLYYTKQLYDRL